MSRRPVKTLFLHSGKLSCIVVGQFVNRQSVKSSTPRSISTGPLTFIPIGIFFPIIEPSLCGVKRQIQLACVFFSQNFNNNVTRLCLEKPLGLRVYPPVFGRRARGTPRVGRTWKKIGVAIRRPRRVVGTRAVVGGCGGRNRRGHARVRPRVAHSSGAEPQFVGRAAWQWPREHDPGRNPFGRLGAGKTWWPTTWRVNNNACRTRRR